MDRVSLSQYLFFEYCRYFSCVIAFHHYRNLQSFFCSNEDFKLWSNGLKRVLLDHNIERMEYLMNQHQCCKAAEIKCRACRNPMFYMQIDDSVDEIRWICIHCPSREILRCRADETVNAIIKLTRTTSPQLVALTMNIILNNFNNFNSLSQPDIPDNPISILCRLHERSKGESFKLGGNDVVIVADVFKSIQSSQLLPILYLADTINIPTRYYLNALTSALVRGQVPPKSNDNDDDEDENDDEESNNNDHVEFNEAQIVEFVQELVQIANRVIKPNSYLLLGPTLQSLIPPKYYNDKLYNFNLRAIVPVTELKLFETTTQQTSSAANAGGSTNNIDDGLEKIVNPALAICSIVNTLLLRKVTKYTTVGELQIATQKYLNTAIWLRMFVGTPFESLLYNIINDDQTVP